MALAQGRGGGGPGNNDNLDTELRALIAEHNLRGDPVGELRPPSIRDPLARLGRQLFFSKALGGELDSACVSCHHPLLGGADALSLPVGVGAINPDWLGPGREHIDGLPPVPENDDDDNDKDDKPSLTAIPKAKGKGKKPPSPDGELKPEPSV